MLRTIFLILSPWNEALDIFVYNFVALKILNPNFEVLEKYMVGVEAKPLKKAVFDVVRQKKTAQRFLKLRR